MGNTYLSAPSILRNYLSMLWLNLIYICCGDPWVRNKTTTPNSVQRHDITHLIFLNACNPDILKDFNIWQSLHLLIQKLSQILLYLTLIINDMVVFGSLTLSSVIATKVFSLAVNADIEDERKISDRAYNFRDSMLLTTLLRTYTKVVMLTRAKVV